jgi:SAM-dependent methyltransferase
LASTRSPRTSARSILSSGRRALDLGIQRVAERRYGGDFGHKIYLDEFGLEGEGREPYLASPWLSTKRALRRAQLGRHDVVADLGSGMGFGVILAAEYPIARSLGVELAPELVEMARRNAELSRSRIRAGAVEMIEADILEWDVPDDLSVVYMFCPFKGELFQSVLDHIIAAHDRHPRPLRIVYSYPWEHNRIAASGRFQAVDVIPFQWPPRPRWWRRPEVVVTYAIGDGPFPPIPGRLAKPEALSFWAGVNDAGAPAG